MTSKRKSRKVLVLCAVCYVEFERDAYEVKRNAALGRVNCCNRRCHATWMNLSPEKQAQTKAMLAERNSNQWREANPNWKGGISGKLQELPPEVKINRDRQT